MTRPSNFDDKAGEKSAGPRAAMVESQLVARGVRDPGVLEAMRAVPRECFVPVAVARFAYEDGALPIEAGQTISQPFIVARMIEAAEVKPGDHVLEVGAGSGYAAAVLGRIAERVDAIERHAELVALARARMAALGAANIFIHQGDGSGGWPAGAPFDAILVAAGAPEVPAPLREQLAFGGRLVMPIGASEAQRLVHVTRTGEDLFESQDLGLVRFVPLVGAHGWSEDEVRD